jgi:hypothetical protein
MLLCLVPLGLAEGQPVLNWQAEVAAGHTDNLFRSFSRRGEWTRQLSLDLACTITGLEFYYWAQADLYDRYPDLFTQTHGLGLSPTRPRMGRGARRPWTADLSLVLRDGRPGYDYKDYLGVEGNLAAKRYLGPQVLVRTALLGTLRAFRAAREYSFSESSLRLEASRFLRTRTTLQAGIEPATKIYLHAAGDSTAAYPRPEGGRLQGLNTFWFRLAQGLGRTTGLQLEYRRQASTGVDPSGVAFDPTAELFDDAYGQHGSRMRAALRHQGRGFEVRASAHRERRHYDRRPVLDLSGAPLGTSDSREDTRTSGLLAAEHRLDWTHGLTLELVLGLEASIEQVDSNDPYYDATIRAVTVSVRLAR